MSDSPAQRTALGSKVPILCGFETSQAYVQKSQRDVENGDCTLEGFMYIFIYSKAQLQRQQLTEYLCHMRKR